MDKITFKNNQEPALNETNLNLLQDNMEKAGVIVSATEPTSGEKVWIQKGKNLINLNYCDMKNYSNANASLIQENAITINALGSWGRMQIDDFVVENGKTYTFSANYSNSENSPTSIIIYNANDDTLNYQNNSAQSGKFEVTFTANTSKVKIRFSVNNTSETKNNTVTYTNIQLEVGNTATTFEEYIPQRIYYKENDTWIRFIEEQPSRNIMQMQVIPVSNFGQIDVNQVIINNKMVEINFRGYLNSDINNNNPIIYNIPAPLIGSNYTCTIFTGGEYSVETMKWAYISSGQLKGDYLPANTWVHISINYIQE